MNYVRSPMLFSRPPLPFAHICNIFCRPAPSNFLLKSYQTLNQLKNYLKTIEVIFLFFTRWLQRKRKEFSPTYLHLVGRFLASFLGHLELLEIYRSHPSIKLIKTKTNPKTFRFCKKILMRSKRLSKY